MAGDAERGWRRLKDEHLDPLAHAVRRHVRMGRRLFEGNIASALAGSLNTLARTGHAPLDTLVRQPWAQPDDMAPYGRWIETADGLRYARTTCCGYEKVPNSGRCGDCSLTWRSRL